MEFKHFTKFINKYEKFGFFKQCGLLDTKRKTLKEDFVYKGVYREEPTKCEVIGYVDEIEVVIKFPNGEKHSIHPLHLKDMQRKGFSKE